MEVLFLGTGEACDTRRCNTSVLIRSGSSSLLLDCGFTTCANYFRLERPPSEPDLVWISHLHGDHFFGLPQLLLHLYERRRTEPLHIVGGIPLESEVSKAMELAYPGLLAKFPFQLIFTRIPAGRSVELLDLEIRVAANTHSIESFGVLIKSGSRSVYYSGDGKSRNAGIDLMTGADLVIHESFSIRDRFANHGSVNTCLEIFRQTGCRKMALVHLCRESRAQEQDIEHLIRNAGNDIFLPRDQETIILD